MFKKILVGITGGIAAYKAIELVRLLKSAGAEVRVIMTKAAQQLVTPLTFRSISNHTVYTDLFQSDVNLNTKIEHIDLARWAEVLLIAPATANIIAKMAHGIADDLLSTVCLATTATVAVAPAMNHQMWHNPATQSNIAILAQRHIHIFEPTAGIQACGEVGIGRMQEPQQLFAALSSLSVNNTSNNLINPNINNNNSNTHSNSTNNVSDILIGYRVIITAGATHETIDGVRYLSNYSSGKMGYALAQAAHEAGAQVVLISGPSNLDSSAINANLSTNHDIASNPKDNLKIINVTTAQEMYDAVMHQIKASNFNITAAEKENSETANGTEVNSAVEIMKAKAANKKNNNINANLNCNIFIAAAAVADYRPIKTFEQKLKRENKAVISLDLERTKDILSAVTALPQHPFTIGFAAETENLLENAAKKLAAKNADMIVANKVGFDRSTKQPIGFNSDQNELTVLRKSSKDIINLPLTSKHELAKNLIKIIHHEILSVNQTKTL